MSTVTGDCAGRTGLTTGRRPICGIGCGAEDPLAHLDKFIQIKEPKLVPPDGTAFDFKGVHFLTLSGTCLLCTKAQNWTLIMLNPVLPWRCRFKVTYKSLLKSRCPIRELRKIKPK